MEAREKIEFEKEENDRYLTDLKKAREKWLRIGVISEMDLPIEERENFRKWVISFINNKEEIAEDIAREIETSIAFYQI